MNEYNEIMKLNQENYRIEIEIKNYIEIILSNYQKRSFEYRIWKQKVEDFLDYLSKYKGDDYPKDVEIAMGLNRQNIFCSISNHLFTLVKKRKNNQALIDLMTPKDDDNVKTLKLEYTAHNNN